MAGKRMAGRKIDAVKITYVVIGVTVAVTVILLMVRIFSAGGAV